MITLIREAAEVWGRSGLNEKLTSSSIASVGPAYAFNSLSD